MNKVAYLPVLVLFLLVAVSTSHAASSALYTSPVNISVNASSQLLHLSVMVFGNQSFTVYPNSASNLFFSTSKFPVTKIAGYNFSFEVNGTKAQNLTLNFTTNSSAYVSVPVHILGNAVSPNSSNSSQPYSINIVGQVADYHSVTISVSDKATGSLVSSGEVIM